jgi:short-subunit dehydrogenase
LAHFFSPTTYKLSKMETYTEGGIKQRRLAGQTVVITGASSGAGRAAALEFAKNGANIVLAARRQEALAELVDECREFGANAIAVPTDVTDDEAMKELANTAYNFGGRIDVWINNAGVLAAGEFTDTPIEVHDRVIQINLMGYLHGAHAALPYFKRQAHGVLINNISVGGWLPVPYGVGYSASKFGLRGYSEALRGELIKYPHIHICDLYPAFLDTPGIQHAANYTGREIKPAPPVFDPQRVARAMVSVAIRPRNSVTIGSTAPLLKLAYSLFPGITRAVTAKLIEAYLKKAEPTEATSGNLFESPAFGSSIHGGWNSPADMEIRRQKIKRSLVVAGVATGLAFLGVALKKKQKSAQYR